jgi:membrane protease YdiL (CAAX protease family)
MSEKTINKKNDIILYIIINLLMSAILSLAISKKSDATRNIILLLMFIPSITAIIFQKIDHISIKQFFMQSVKVTSFKSVIFAIMYPLLFISTCAAVSLAIGSGRLNVDKMLNVNRFINFAINSVITILPAIGEEYGWRGFLLPKLIKIQGEVKAAISLSIVWVLYHIPVIYIIARIGTDNTTISLLVQASSLFVLAFSFSYCYYISKSVISLTIMHAFWNSVNTWILGDIFSYKTAMIEGNIFFINGEGLIGFVLGIIPMVIFIKKMYKDKTASIEMV